MIGPIAQLVIGVGLQLIGNLFMPGPEKPKPPHLSDYDGPTSDSSRPIPAIFGTVEVKGLNALWSGDKSIDKRDVKIPKGK